MILKDLLMATESFADRVSQRVGEALNAANIRDINPIQALLLRRLGGDETTVGNIVLQQFYVGSNVSYNIKSLIDSGYFVSRIAPTDRRVHLVRVTKKGLAIGQLVAEVEDKCVEHLDSCFVPVGILEDMNRTLGRINRVLG